MRSIKFRFFSKETDRYVDASDYCVTGNGDIYCISDLRGYQESHELSRVIDKEQSTGLKDKNGFDIYEGDIFFDGIENCTIEWCEDSASFIANDSTEKHDLGEWTQHELIIGNIHQNPELFERFNRRVGG